MANSYYNYLLDLIPGTKTRSQFHDDQFAAIERGFDLLGDPGELNSGAGIYGIDTGTADAYIVDNSTPAAALITGQLVTFAPINANTGPSTISLNGNPNVAIVRSNGSNLEAGDLTETIPVFAIYDGTRFVLLSPTPSDTRPGVTAVSSSRLITASDEGAILKVDTSAGDVTLTAPVSATEDLPIGFIVHLYNQGANDVIAAAEGGVTLNQAIGPRTRTTFSTISLIKLGINEWNVIGDATA